MENNINYNNNPLHGIGLKQVITEIVNYYGFDILFSYLNRLCNLCMLVYNKVI